MYNSLSVMTRVFLRLFTLAIQASGGVRQFLVEFRSRVRTGSPWLTLSHSGSLCFTLAHHVSLLLKIFLLSLFCTIWVTLAHTGKCWLISDHTSRIWLTLAHSGSHRTKILAHVRSPKRTGTDCRSPPEQPRNQKSNHPTKNKELDTTNADI